MPPGDTLVLDHDHNNPEAPMDDISANCLELTLEQDMQAHSAMMLESRGNAASAHNITRHASARKFNQEDPIEAAAVEMILSGSPNVNISGTSPRA